LLGPGDGGAGVAGDPAGDERVPAGWHTETWHDLEIAVPDSWGYGVLSTWCVGGAKEPAPVVERPGGMREMILCQAPAEGYGVKFYEEPRGGVDDPVNGTVSQMGYPGDGQPYPQGAWSGHQVLGHTGVQIVTSDQATAETIRHSAREVTDLDSNGCSPEPPDQPSPAADGTVRLCRYGGDGWLEQSEVLTARDAAEAIEAIAAAPAAQVRRCMSPADRTYVTVTAGEVQGSVALDQCLGLYWDEQPKELTADVLYWVLSPGWSGQIPDGVTIDKLRTR
jgi:hypothetical protein